MFVWLAVIALLSAGLAAFTTATAVVAGAADGTRLLSSGGTTTIRALATGSDAVQFPEFAFDPDEGEEEGEAPDADAVVNRSLSGGAQPGEVVASARKAKSRPELVTSFNGLNHRDQRLANNGNQFSIEPPDQGLCVGNGFVLETVNDVLRVYDTAGNALVGVADQNTFYGYAPAINRTTGLRGPFVTDPSCIFDADVQRWFHVVLTLEVNPVSGAFLGPNHLDLAVSNTASPLGSWTIYRLPVQDDGTQGTPDHDCVGGPCLGDYPHIGADANGFYISTNEYSFFDPNSKFIAAQLYAFPKARLAAGAATVPVVQFDTRGLVAGNPGFTVWPAVSPRGGYELGAGGTEYFLSSMAAEEANGTGTDDRIALWALTNTRSLNTATPDLALRNTILGVRTYAQPPKADQKPGDIPLGQCVNDTTLPTPAGPGCWRLLLAAEPAHDEVESRLDSNDTRMQQVTFANGKVWGALDSAVTVGGEAKAGIGWYVVKPTVTSAGVSGVVAKEGLLGIAGNHVTYPAIGVLPNGRGVMAFTLVGTDHYPSAAYAPIDAQVGVGDIRVAADGRGPSDGFTSYKAFVGNPPRTRWGDYGAAAVDGDSLWIASEYIAQTCTFAQYVSGAVGSCGGTRTSLANWGTRISRLKL